MAANIQFDSAQALGVAESIKRKAESAQGVITQLTNEIHAINSWWHGESQKAFVDQYDSLKPSFDKMIECVQTISANMKQIVSIKEEAEQQMAAKLRSK
ncbi:WXG100 family type VII secretion target [Paenibacillus soyae]|uniref:ESAT-6-like protein n=1 Tax=Paenibacillus soyae TaxID=2969249 RepID=A0A9X2MK69_9BACL|nr:WXG100 family type VII secretion target [Paenibacillus soyae]MCR2803398.1 WXG100 family type VII secretion target [Paenibacillus soyae]